MVNGSSKDREDSRDEVEQSGSLVETFFISFSRIEITISKYNVQVCYKFVADKKLFVCALCKVSPVG